MLHRRLTIMAKNMHSTVKTTAHYAGLQLETFFLNLLKYIFSVTKLSSKVTPMDWKAEFSSQMLVKLYISVIQS